MRTTLLLVTLVALTLPLTASALTLAPAPPSANATVNVVATCGVACTFDPPLVAIKPGDTVVWRIANICHSVTAGLTTETEGIEGVIPGANAFDSGALCAGTYSRTFSEAGAFLYYCNVGFHRLLGMHGAVVVA